MSRTIQELQQLQALPLNVKIEKTKQRIREWVDHFGLDGVYVSFSGGKDSTVLLDIARQIYPSIQAVFCDTGLEFPEIRQFVRTFDNVVWLKPKMNFKQTVLKYGYPFISKEVSECVYGARKYLTRVLEEEHASQASKQASKQADLFTHNSSANSAELGNIPVRIRETHSDRAIRTDVESCRNPTGGV